jgi:outer membrane protein assembly factor BamB
MPATTRPSVLAFTLFAVVCVSSGAEAQWTQFGGPTRDFKSPETGLLDSWPADGPSMIWEVEHEGGHASILVDGDALFSMFKDGDKNEVLRSINRADGTTRWEFKYTVPSVPDKVMLNFGLGPNATPIISGDQICSISFLGQLHCLNKNDGTLLWSHDLVRDYGAKVHTFGYSISPLAYQGGVIVGVGSERHGLIAFDRSTGEPVWKSPPIDVSYASPMLIDVGDQTQLLLFGSVELVALDPQNGEILWRFPHLNLNKNNCSMPLWGDDQRLIIGSHSDGGASALTLELRRRSGRALTHVHEAWHTDEIVFFHTSAIRVGDHIYTTSGTSPPNDLIAFDVTTGKVAWREPGYSKANLLLADGKMFMMTEDGTVSLARMTPEGMTVISSFKPLVETAWAPPTIADGVLYVRDEKSVKAFRIR